MKGTKKSGPESPSLGPEDEMALKIELGRFGYTIFTAIAWAFRSLAASEPRSFGPLTVEAEAAENAAANAKLQRARDLLRADAGILETLRQRYETPATGDVVEGVMAAAIARFTGGHDHDERRTQD